MASENARKVAKKVLENLGKGKKIVLGDILKESGYADNTASNPKNVTETKTFQEAVLPVVKRLEKERDRAIVALSNKDLTAERYHDLVDGLDKLTKNIQLLSGGATERVAIPISNEFIQDSNRDSQDSETQEEA